ncbi:YoaK family protein [Intestinimonas sp.]|uniref:YoaK family protein n=1 Tax=Intestinimonas sp. TaxID=1965293 RepID=UPI002942720A|nr:YoaK family protein [uncultured Intestinimonas sp.]
MKRPAVQMSETYFLGALLTVGGGFLDAYTYFTRGGVFSNAQTGNLVLLAIRLAQGDLTALPRYLPPILAFALGVVAAELIRDRLHTSRTLHWRQAVVALEALILLVTAFLPQGPWDAAVNVTVSFVCAMQVETFRKIRGNALATTMCTGNLRSGTELLYHGLRSRDTAALKRSLQYYGIILCFLLGGALGVWTTDLLAERAILLCCALLGVIFLSMFRTPEEDK